MSSMFDIKKKRSRHKPDPLQKEREFNMKKTDKRKKRLVMHKIEDAERRADLLTRLAVLQMALDNVIDFVDPAGEEFAGMMIDAYFGNLFGDDADDEDEFFGEEEYGD